jgi:hypothetical protein
MFNKLNGNNFIKPPVNQWNSTKSSQTAGNSAANKGFKVDKFERQPGIPGLSAAAQSLLGDLRKKFSNVDFIIADFSSSEEANRHLRRGSGEYNCVITPDLLEKMAACAETRALYEGKLAEAVGRVGELSEAIKANPDISAMVKSLGISVGTDGVIEFHAMLVDSLPKQVNDGSRTVKASSIEELMKKLDEIDEERRQQENWEKRNEKYGIDTKV